MTQFLKTTAHIESWLQKHRIKNYTVNADLSVDVNSDVRLRNSKLTSIPLQFRHVSGNFDCQSNQLRGLNGAPSTVKGDFNCYDNQLSSLEGGPLSVEGEYNCSQNSLTTLEFLPPQLGSHFYCSFNPLTSLKGVPKIIKGDFFCCCNTLTSLAHAPTRIEGKFWCAQNALTHLQHVPKTIGDDFFCESNDLNTLIYFPKNIKGTINMSENPALGEYQLITQMKKVKIIVGILQEQQRLKDHGAPMQPDSTYNKSSYKI